MKVTVRSLRETMRRLAMVPVKTEGARYLQAVWPFELAWLWTFQAVVPTGGGMRSRRAALAISCLKRAR